MPRSLLPKVGDEAAQGGRLRISLHEQENDSATAEIKQGNTLASPLFEHGEALQTFDYGVANPPFSDKRWSTGLDLEPDPVGRLQGRRQSEHP